MAKRIRELKTEVVATGKEKHVYRIFELIKRKESLAVTDQTIHFNNTELRLIAEVLAAKYVGKRLISTQLAQLLGVTRSAISQIVNRLEKNGVVKRVADDVDRKIAYIEVTGEILSTYRKDLDLCVEFANKVVEEFGEERFESMYVMFQDFCDVLEKTAATMKKKEQKN